MGWTTGLSASTMHFRFRIAFRLSCSADSWRWCCEVFLYCAGRLVEFSRTSIQVWPVPNRCLLHRTALCRCLTVRSRIRELRTRLMPRAKSCVIPLLHRLVAYSSSTLCCLLFGFSCLLCTCLSQLPFSLRAHWYRWLGTCASPNPFGPNVPRRAMTAKLTGESNMFVGGVYSFVTHSVRQSYLRKCAGQILNRTVFFPCPSSTSFLLFPHRPSWFVWGFPALHFSLLIFSLICEQCVGWCTDISCQGQMTRRADDNELVRTSWWWRADRRKMWKGKEILWKDFAKYFQTSFNPSMSTTLTPSYILVL